jgi:hypothetical protein
MVGAANSLEIAQSVSVFYRFVPLCEQPDGDDVVNIESETEAVPMFSVTDPADGTLVSVSYQGINPFRLPPRPVQALHVDAVRISPALL